MVTSHMKANHVAISPPPPIPTHADGWDNPAGFLYLASVACCTLAFFALLMPEPKGAAATAFAAAT